MTSREQRRRDSAFLLAHVMHIRPWEYALMTVQELDDAIAACEEYARAMEREGAEARRTLGQIGR